MGEACGRSCRVLLADRPKEIRLFYRQAAGGAHRLGKWVESLPFRKGSIEVLLRYNT